MSLYLHNVPGRLRVKVPSIIGRPEKGREVHRLLDGRAGIDNVSVNTVTGSVLVHYDIDSTGAEAVMNALGYHRFIDPSSIGRQVRTPGPVSQKARERVGKAIIGWAVGRALEANGFGFLAAFI